MRLIFCIALISFVVAESDRDILLDLYKSTDGPNWSINVGWGSDSSICSWYGVTCDSGGRVIELNLGSNTLHGILPDSIGNLKHLRVLDIGENVIPGSLPDSMQNLKNLSVLIADSCQITGNIPEWLSDFEDLVTVVLSYNNLEGSIPDLFGKRFYRLDLISCGLSGAIPDSIGNLKSIQYLRLIGNKLSGNIPDFIGNLQNLKELALEENQFEGNIPDSFQNLNNIELLRLGGNQLSGEVPDFLSTLSSLKDFGLQDNQFTSLSASFQMNSVSKCYLNNNPFKCPISVWAQHNCEASCS